MPSFSMLQVLDVNLSPHQSRLCNFYSRAAGVINSSYRIVSGRLISLYIPRFSHVSCFEDIIIKLSGWEWVELDTQEATRMSQWVFTCDMLKCSKRQPQTASSDVTWGHFMQRTCDVTWCDVELTFSSHQPPWATGHTRSSKLWIQPFIRQSKLVLFNLFSFKNLQSHFKLILDIFTLWQLLDTVGSDEGERPDYDWFNYLDKVFWHSCRSLSLIGWPSYPNSLPLCLGFPPPRGSLHQSLLQRW